MNFDNYLFRCSSLGKLMVSSRSKTDPLSKSTKSYLNQIFKNEYFGKYQEIDSKYTDKGKRVEDDAIEMLSKVEDTFMFKNTERFQDDYFTGEPDVINFDEIIDIKSSWSHNTFPLTEDVIPNKDYFYQLQGYMKLTERRKARLVYCLMTTPEDLIDSAKRKAMNSGVMDIDKLDGIGFNMSYDDIDPKRRIKVFEVEYDQKVIDELHAKIDLAREYLNNIKI